MVYGALSDDLSVCRMPHQPDLCADHKLSVHFFLVINQIFLVLIEYSFIKS